ncbi:MAG: GspH/FimT family pseudopilin [bacterium]
MYKLRVLQKGMTMLEIMVTLAILAIVATLAMPSLREFMQNSATGNSSQLLLADIAFARSEAVTRPGEIFFVQAGGGWQNGWSIYFDTDTNGSLDPTDELIRTRDALEDGFSLELEDSSSNTYSQISFETDGSLKVPTVEVTFSLCRPDDDTAKSKSVIISTTGRPEVRKGVTAC